MPLARRILVSVTQLRNLGTSCVMLRIIAYLSPAKFVWYRTSCTSRWHSCLLLTVLIMSLLLVQWESRNRKVIITSAASAVILVLERIQQICSTVGEFTYERVWSRKAKDLYARLIIVLSNLPTLLT